jgi:hypothetical protein
MMMKVLKIARCDAIVVIDSRRKLFSAPGVKQLGGLQIYDNHMGKTEMQNCIALQHH